MIGYAALTLLAVLGWLSAWYFRDAYFELLDAAREMEAELHARDALPVDHPQRKPAKKITARKRKATRE